MTSSDPQPSQDVSARQLGAALAVALSVALVTLFVAVLPAEYGIDPLGSGRALGLVHDSAAVVEPEAPASLDAAMAPTPVGPSVQYAAPYRIDHRTFELGPYEFLEYKYRLRQGANMIFSWQASAPVLHDFHGAPDGQGSDAESSVDKQTRSRASGALTAPFSGMHGWYWENPGASTITIELHGAGFFTSATERRSSGRRVVHELEPPDPAAAAGPVTQSPN